MGAEPYTQQSVDELFKAAYQAPARKEWQETTRPTIQEAYSGPGYWSSARANAVAKGAQDLNDTLASQHAQLSYNADAANKELQESAANRALSSVASALSYNAEPISQALSGIQGTNALYGLASQEQQQNQAEIAANMQKWAEQNQITDPDVLNMMISLLGMDYRTGSSQNRGKGLGYDAANNFFSSLGQMGSDSNNAGMMNALAAIGMPA